MATSSCAPATREPAALRMEVSRRQPSGRSLEASPARRTLTAAPCTPLWQPLSTAQHMRDYLQFHLFGTSAAVTALAFFGWYLWLVFSFGIFFQPQTILGVLSTAGLGGMLGVLFVYQLTLSALNLQRRLRGFEVLVGFRVRILGGPRRGEVARVYELWEQRGEVRLELGEAAHLSVTDVYMAYQVRRVVEG